MRSANGKLIREALDDIVISLWGTSKVLLIDNGTEFVNKTIEYFVKENGNPTHYYSSLSPASRPGRAGERSTKNDDCGILLRESS